MSEVEFTERQAIEEALFYLKRELLENFSARGGGGYKDTEKAVEYFNKRLIKMDKDQEDIQKLASIRASLNHVGVDSHCFGDSEAR